MELLTSFLSADWDHYELSPEDPGVWSLVIQRCRHSEAQRSGCPERRDFAAFEELYSRYSYVLECAIKELSASFSVLYRLLFLGYFDGLFGADETYM